MQNIQLIKKEKILLDRTKTWTNIDRSQFHSQFAIWQSFIIRMHWWTDKTFQFNSIQFICSFHSFISHLASSPFFIHKIFLFFIKSIFRPDDLYDTKRINNNDNNENGKRPRWHVDCGKSCILFSTLLFCYGRFFGLIWLGYDCLLGCGDGDGGSDGSIKINCCPSILLCVNDVF